MSSKPDGSRLGSKLENGCFVVIALEDNPGLIGFVQSVWPTVKYCGSPAKETFRLQALLVRPDGIVAWVCEKETELGSLKDALSRWFQGYAVE